MNILFRIFQSIEIVSNDIRNETYISQKNGRKHLWPCLSENSKRVGELPKYLMCFPCLPREFIKTRDFIEPHSLNS